MFGRTAVRSSPALLRQTRTQLADLSPEQSANPFLAGSGGLVQFDWLKFLQRHRIEYVTTGANVASDNVNIPCPFCGSGDPSYHLGISLSGHGWGCWRSRAHRGKDPARLIAALLQISLAQARNMIGAGAPNVADASVQDRVQSLMQPIPPQTEHVLAFPPEIKLLDWSYQKPAMFFDYLYGRGYTKAQAVEACRKFYLRYAMTGEFAYRIIFPIRNDAGELVSWTGRAIAPDQEVRYKTLSTHRGSLLARGPITDYLLREHKLSGDRTLVVCEGPFDALRVETVCAQDGVNATCLFTKTASEQQVAKLAELAKYYKQKFLLLDADAELSSLAEHERLRVHGFQNLRLPITFKDPAETPSDILRNLFKPKSRRLGHDGEFELPY